MTYLKHISPSVQFRILVLFVFAFNVYAFMDVCKLCFYFLSYQHNYGAIPWMDIAFSLIGLNIFQVVGAFVFRSKWAGWVLGGLLMVNLIWFVFVLFEIFVWMRQMWVAGIFAYVLALTCIPLFLNSWLLGKVFNRFLGKNNLTVGLLASHEG